MQLELLRRAVGQLELQVDSGQGSGFLLNPGAAQSWGQGSGEGTGAPFSEPSQPGAPILASPGRGGPSTHLDLRSQH